MATDVEHLAGFTFLQTIELDELDDLLMQVVTVGFGHGLSDRFAPLPVYALTALVVAIYQIVGQFTVG